MFSEFSNESRQYLTGKAAVFRLSFENWGRDAAIDLIRLQRALQEYLGQRINDLQIIYENVSSGSLTIRDVYNRAVPIPIPVEFRSQWMDQLRTELETMRSDKVRLEEMMRNKEAL